MSHSQIDPSGKDMKMEEFQGEQKENASSWITNIENFKQMLGRTDRVTIAVAGATMRDIKGYNVDNGSTCGVVSCIMKLFVDVCVIDIIGTVLVPRRIL
jgi:hypothetical protein